MKNKLTVLAMLLTLLCGCTAAKAPHVSEPATVPTIPVQPVVTTAEVVTSEPVYDDAPALSQTAVTIQGLTLDQTYETEEVVFVRLADFAATLGGVVTQQENEDGTFRARMYWPDGEVRLDNAKMQLLWQQTEVLLPQRCLFDGTNWYVPASALLEAAGYTRLNDREQNHLYFTRWPDLSQVPADCEVPVLMYHAVSDNIWSGNSGLFVSPSTMAEQLKYLNDNGYSAIWFEDLPQAAQYEKPVILTFDDGYIDNYEELFPLLQEYNIKATVFCVAGSLGSGHIMSAEQVKQMSDSGLVSIQSHTMTHPFLSTLGEQDTYYELYQSQLQLTRVTGKQPFVLCYPTGDYSNLTLEIARQHYILGILMSRGRYSAGADPMLIGRRYVQRSTTIYEFANMIG